jgi:hypothetical protein
MCYVLKAHRYEPNFLPLVTYEIDDMLNDRYKTFYYLYAHAEHKPQRGILYIPFYIAKMPRITLKNLFFCTEHEPERTS